MFHNMPYEKWLDEEPPKCLKVAKEHDVLYIGSVSGIGPVAETPGAVHPGSAGARRSDHRARHGRSSRDLGAIDAHKDVGAPCPDPDIAYKVTKACVDIAKVPIMFKTTPQCVNAAALALAIQRAGGHAISGNNAFYGAWIDHEKAGVSTVCPAPWVGLRAVRGRSSAGEDPETTATIPEMPFLGGGGVCSPMTT